MSVYNHYYPDINNFINTPDSANRLAFEGPTIPVTVSLTAQHIAILQRQRLAIPLPVSGNALIDTGASLCLVDEGAIRSLGIPPFGVTSIHTPSGPSQQPTYPASLSFPGTPIPNISFTNFIGCPLQATGIIAIIGRNVLKGFVLHYNGPGGSICLAY